VLGTSACRFASPELANAITGFGREILLGTKARIEARGLRVLYGDTDSLFVLSGVDDPARAQALGEGLVEDLNRELADWIDATWRVPSRLSLQFERLYRRLFLSSVRTGQGGARKRYAGLVEENGQSRVIFTGMEIVRRDWTELAKRVQREMYERLFSDRPVDDYLRGVVQDVRAGRLDGLLVYRKGLRRKLETYTAGTPPHVAAARKMSGKPGSVIEYVMTTEGPEPADEREAPIDREHYVQKQVRAVAEPVLDALGLTFDAAVGDDHQLELF
jgi:DNA polymerase-2